MQSRSKRCNILHLPPVSARVISRLLLVPVFSSMALAAPPLAAPFAAVREYGYMHWVDGLRDPNFRIQTSRFLLNYDHRAFGPSSLRPLAHAPDEASALFVYEAPGAPLGFSCTIAGNGLSGAFTAASPDLRTSQIIESGKFFQRRWQPASLPAGIAADPARTGLETAAWPDRISFVLRLTPAAPVAGGLLTMALDLPDGYRLLPGEGPVRALVAADGSGFVAMGAAASTGIAIDPATATLTATSAQGDWQPGMEVSAGLIFFPASRGVRELMQHLAAEETTPLGIRASGIVPAVGTLPVRYDRDRGYFRIPIPKGTDGDDGCMRARIRITNPHPWTRMARLNFDGVPFHIPGITAVLRNTQGDPLGIPVQLSKNWHGPPSSEDGPGGFAGHWFHGLTLIAVPPSSTWEGELMMAGENWGGMAAASHAQLSITGYGGNQQWDEVALGNRGEALCYDMDHTLTDNDFTDSRPFHAIDAKGGRGWGINVGGGSVLRYVDGAGTVRHHAGMRVRYVRHGPNLTEAIFAGHTDDRAMDFHFTAATPRAADCTRGYHRIRIDVRKDTSFQRLAFYQQSGDTYSYNQGDGRSLGHAGSAAPLRSWRAVGKPDTIAGPAVPLDGPSPWVAVTHGSAEKDYRPANHGFIIRSWKARIGGCDQPRPYFQERTNRANVSLFELVPPPEVSQLLAGDFVEIDLVRIYVPRSADNYGGTDAGFRRALIEFDNDPRMILREAAGNHLRLTTRIGTLQGLHPPRILAAENRAEFTLHGGIGAVPVTFTGLTDYHHPRLEQRMGEQWIAIDQSVVGNDFWQCDFNAASGTWEITFTLIPDGAGQDLAGLIAEPRQRDFRFRVGVE